MTSAGSMAGSAAAAPNRPSVIQLVFRERLRFTLYMPALTDGGLFVATTRRYVLGDDIYLLLSLPGDNQRYPCRARSPGSPRPTPRVVAHRGWACASPQTKNPSVAH